MRIPRDDTFEYYGDTYYATVKGGKLVSAAPDYGSSATFSDYGTTEIIVPAGRPAMPKAMEKAAFDSAMEATKSAKLYYLTYFDSDEYCNYELYYDCENYQAYVYVRNYGADTLTRYLICVEGDKVVTYTKINDNADEKTEQPYASSEEAQEAWLAAIKAKITVLDDILAEELNVSVNGEDTTVIVDNMYSAIKWENDTSGIFDLVIDSSYSQQYSIRFEEGKLSRIMEYSIDYDAGYVRGSIEGVMHEFGLINYD